MQTLELFFHYAVFSINVDMLNTFLPKERTEGVGGLEQYKMENNYWKMETKEDTMINGVNLLRMNL